MPLLRYKNRPDEPFNAGSFNTSALAEVLTGDDSAYIKDLDVCIDGEWKDLGQAFNDRDLITDNYNTRFFEPKTVIDKARGYTLE